MTLLENLPRKHPPKKLPSILASSGPKIRFRRPGDLDAVKPFGLAHARPALHKLEPLVQS